MPVLAMVLPWFGVVLGSRSGEVVDAAEGVRVPS